MRRRTTVAVGGTLIVLLAVIATAALAFPTAEARGTSKPIELPRELQQLVFRTCLPGLTVGSGTSDSDGEGVDAEQGLLFSSSGSTSGSPTGLSVRIESVGAWSVSVGRAGAVVRNERLGADETELVTLASEVIPAAKSLYDCLAPYRFAAQDAPSPSSGAQLLQLYRYDTAVLWPCLTSHGIDVGPPPSRDEFVSSFSAVTADPIAAITPTTKVRPRLVSALRACPLRPAYLG